MPSACFTIGGPPTNVSLSLVITLTAETARNEDRYVRAASRSILPLLGLGRIAAATERADEVVRRSAGGVGGVARGFAETAYSSVATFRGEWSAVERHSAAALALSARSNYYDVPLEVLPTLAYARLQQGEWDEARDAVDLWTGARTSSRGWAFHQLIDAAAGNVPDVIRCASERPDRTHWKGHAAHFSLPTFAVLIELANAIGDPTMLEYPRAVLRDARRRGRAFASPWPVLLDRICGIAAAGQDDAAAAAHHFDRAVVFATAEGARPELGLTLLDRARLLGLAGDAAERKRAVEDLTEAVRIFGQLGMQPALDRCGALAERLDLSVAPAPAPTGLAARHGLTPRQLEVLGKLASGLSNDEIAAQLTITPATARRHVADIFQRLDVNNRASAVKYWFEHGLME